MENETLNVQIREPWQMLEDEFADWFADTWIRGNQSRKQTPHRRWWLEQFRTRSDEFKRWMRDDYQQTIRDALRENRPIPAAVYEQTPQLRRLRIKFAAYLKCRRTAFANVSSAVDLSMQAEYGVKIKRQDGRPITLEQQMEIASAILEVESAVGPIRDVLRAIDPTISHTSGKHPFMSDTVGLSVVKERTIVIGVKDGAGRPISAFAHEVAHLLDAAAGKAVGRSTHYSDASDEQDLFARARATMNGNERSIDRMLAMKLKDAGSEEERSGIQRRKLRLGRYWRRPTKIFARLVEQYVSTELRTAIRPSKVPALSDQSVVSVDADYTTQPGWWSASALET